VTLAAALELAQPAGAGELVTFQRDRLAIETDGGLYYFEVEIARTPAQRAQGLMFRDRLAEDAGMLFLYPGDQVRGMWMKNTLLPLDMLFIAADGRIVGIVERAVPLSLTAISSEGPVRSVLELNGGASARLGLEPGDRVRHPAFE
jgi:uncharacterized membrane protein (UPF0127 family)